MTATSTDLADNRDPRSGFCKLQVDHHWHALIRRGQGSWYTRHWHALISIDKARTRGWSWCNGTHWYTPLACIDKAGTRGLVCLQEFCNHTPCAALLSKQCSQSIRHRAPHYVSDSVKQPIKPVQLDKLKNASLSHCLASVCRIHIRPVCRIHMTLYVGFIYAPVCRIHMTLAGPDNPGETVREMDSGCEGSCWGILGSLAPGTVWNERDWW